MWRQGRFPSFHSAVDVFFAVMMVRLLALAGCMVLGCATAGGEQPPPNGDAPTVDANTDGPTVGLDANGCATQPCDILSQCGCVATTQACDVDTTDLMGSACRAVASTAH